MQRKSSRSWQAVRFCLGGAVGVIAYYTTLYCLTEYLKIWYIVSAVIAFVINYGLNFVIQKFWTFNDKDTTTVRKQMALYFTMAICLLIGNTIFLYLMVEFLHLWYMLAQVILTVAFTILSFVISRKIFKTKE